VQQALCEWGLEGLSAASLLRPCQSDAGAVHVGDISLYFLAPNPPSLRLEPAAAPFPLPLPRLLPPTSWRPLSTTSILLNLCQYFNGQYWPTPMSFSH